MFAVYIDLSIRSGTSAILFTLIATMRWKTGAQSSSKFWTFWNWKIWSASARSSSACAMAWSSSVRATPIMHRCWPCWGFSSKRSGFVFCCQIKIQHKKYIKREVYEDLGWPWERFQEYIEHDLVCSMQSLHVELGSFWFPRLSVCALILWIPKTLIIMVVVPHISQCEVGN